jgi:hypothetical protein
MLSRSTTFSVVDIFSAIYSEIDEVAWRPRLAQDEKYSRALSSSFDCVRGRRVESEIDDRHGDRLGSSELPRGGRLHPRRTRSAPLRGERRLLGHAGWPTPFIRVVSGRARAGDGRGDRNSGRGPSPPVGCRKLLHVRRKADPRDCALLPDVACGEFTLSPRRNGLHGQ